MTPRTLQPELLDSLVPSDPAAIHNRRDLRIINFVMGNHRWLTRTLRGLRRPGESLVELGAGTGEFAAWLQRRGLPVDGLDLWPRPALWPAERAWHRVDLRAFDGYAAYPVVFGNLIFHQFSDEDLGAVGHRIAQGARVIVACEPVRRVVSQRVFRAIAPLLGANDVTLHDAHVSIAAGFVGDELPRALGLDAARWEWRCAVTALGAYHLVAVRRAT